MRNRGRVALNIWEGGEGGRGMTGESHDVIGVTRFSKLFETIKFRGKSAFARELNRRFHYAEFSCGGSSPPSSVLLPLAGARLEATSSRTLYLSLFASTSRAKKTFLTV